MHQQFILCSWWVVLCGTYVPQLVYPFTCWGTFELFPVFGNAEQSKYKTFFTEFCVNICLYFSMMWDWDCWVIWCVYLTFTPQLTLLKLPETKFYPCCTRNNPVDRCVCVRVRACVHTPNISFKNPKKRNRKPVRVLGSRKGMSQGRQGWVGHSLSLPPKFIMKNFQT